MGGKDGAESHDRLSVSSASQGKVDSGRASRVGFCPAGERRPGPRQGLDLFPRLEAG